MGILTGLRRLLSRDSAEKALASQLPDVLHLTEAEILAPKPGVKTARQLQKIVAPKTPAKTRKGSRPAKKAAKKAKR